MASSPLDDDLLGLGPSSSALPPNNQPRAQSGAVDLLDDLLASGDSGPFPSANSPPPQRPSGGNIKIPYSPALDVSDASVREGITGLGAEAAFQLEGSTIFLYLRLINQTPQPVTVFLPLHFFHSLLSFTSQGFAFLFKENSFKLAPAPGEQFTLPGLHPGQSGEGRIPVCLGGNSNNQPPEFPLKIQVAMKTNLDIFVLNINISFSVLMAPSNQKMSPAAYTELQQRNAAVQQSSLSLGGLSLESLVPKFTANNLRFVASRKNQAGIGNRSFFLAFKLIWPLGF